MKKGDYHLNGIKNQYSGSLDVSVGALCVVDLMISYNMISDDKFMYHCKICSYSVVNQNNFTKHMKNHQDRNRIN